MFKAIVAVVSFLALTACTETEFIIHESPPAAPAPSPATPVVAPSAVETVVADVNQTRTAQGSLPLSRGLSCAVYTVASSITQISGASRSHVGSYVFLGLFDQPDEPSSMGINIMPEAFRMIYKALYSVTCSGQLIVTESGYYPFELTSDDGTILKLDGSVLINNDGTHAVVTKYALKFLSKGAHSFSIDYFDIGGRHALTLTSGGKLVPAENFYR